MRLARQETSFYIHESESEKKRKENFSILL